MTRMTSSPATEQPCMALVLRVEIHEFEACWPANGQIASRNHAHHRTSVVAKLGLNTERSFGVYVSHARA